MMVADESVIAQTANAILSLGLVNVRLVAMARGAKKSDARLVIGEQIVISDAPSSAQRVTVTPRPVCVRVLRESTAPPATLHVRRGLLERCARKPVQLSARIQIAIIKAAIQR